MPGRLSSFSHQRILRTGRAGLSLGDPATCAALEKQYAPHADAQGHHGIQEQLGHLQPHIQWLGDEDVPLAPEPANHPHVVTMRAYSAGDVKRYWAQLKARKHRKGAMGTAHADIIKSFYDNRMAALFDDMPLAPAGADRPPRL